MARFTPDTYSTFLSRMANRLVARTDLSDLEIGGNLHTLLSAVAREFDGLSFQTVNLQDIWDLDSARGADLDARGADLNPAKIARTGASKATTSVVFSRSGTSGAVSIPQGTVVRVAGSGVEFATNVAGSIADTFSDSAAIGVTAVVAGAAGNVDAGTLTQLDAVTGVETVTNAAAATGGQDAELDAQYLARMKAYLRSLPRGTPDALKFAVLDTYLEDHGRIVSAEVAEGTGVNLGTTVVYVDDGSGTIVTNANNSGSPETVVASAIGGELRLTLDNVPVVPASAITIQKNAVTLTETTDYTLERSRGEIRLTTALVAADTVTAEYQWYTGLIAEAQKIIDGDPSDRTNYPGYRAASTNVKVLGPTVLQQTVEASLVVEDAFVGQAAAVRTNVADAINRYINGLGINGDVILSELIYQAQSVAGVLDVTFTVPSANVVIGEGELARVTSDNIDLS